MRFRHNKKRNSAFVFEALTREFAMATLKKDASRIKKVKQVLKEVFNKEKLMYKELKLYKALLETKEVDYLTAEKIIYEVRRAYSSFGEKELKDEHTSAIHKINHDLGPSTFQNYVPNYKSIASAYQIFHDSDLNIKDKVLLERKFVNSMIYREGQQESSEQEPVDEIVVRTFIKKFNKTFGSLMMEQKTLISKYMGSLNSDDIELKIYVNEELQRLKEELDKSLSTEEFQADELMNRKAIKVLNLMEEFKTKRKYSRKDLVFLLKAQELIKEIQQ
jgi:hypothetical protein|tara:strand:- start:5042 stop:5869 length:828 start_codon:yes stop_codon:yes gene_type:complete